MRVRSSRSLVFSLQDGAVVAFNYLTSATFECDPDLLGLLSNLSEWSDFERIRCVAPTFSMDELRETLAALVDAGALVEEDSALAAMEAEMELAWSWGLPAALFHFSVQDRQHMTPEATENMQKRKLAVSDAPDLWMSNDPTHQIRLPSATSVNDLLRLMGRRRTTRIVDDSSLPLGILSECLFAGLGITGYTENCVGRLPLAMTPSGGARNPFEAFVLARAVIGLEPGFYHYSAVQHSLQRIPCEPPASSALLGGQEWADRMPCAIFLCAFAERSMWKYEDANAYRVVMIEAGHIGQNIMLAATQHGLSACPTAALNHSAIQRLLGLRQRSTQWPVYGLTLGRPAKA